MAKNISFTIKYWKQNGPKDKGHFESREMKNIPDDTSFLEMLDILNEELVNEGKEPFVFDHDCREGICGMCSLYINGTPHGKTERGATTCQLYMLRFNDGDVITVEPWRSAGSRLFRQVDIPASVLVRHRTLTLSLSRRRMPTRQWTALHVSVAVHVWLLVRTVRLCSSLVRR